jgi:hypothetical protein
MAIVRNINTGIVTSVPDHYVGHSVLGKNLVLVTDEAQAAPKKETPIKEQPAPVADKVEVVVKPTTVIKPEDNIKEDKE